MEEEEGHWARENANKMAEKKEKKKKRGCDNTLLFGTLQRAEGSRKMREVREMWECDTERLNQGEMREELWSQYMTVCGQLLHFPSSFHPSFHSSFSSVFSVAWLQLWTAKTFFILCWKTQLIIYMFHSVLKPECNPPLPSSTFIIQSLIHRSPSA